MKATDDVKSRRKRFEEASDWVLRHRGGDQDRDGFAAWLAHDPENRIAYEAAERLLGEARAAMLADPELKDVTGRPRRARGVAPTVLVIGSAAGAAMLALGLFARPHSDVVAGPDETPLITLADGSVMQLDAGSAARTEFTATGRRVHLLRGEAYFKVAADLKRPFVVEAAGGSTTAHGTAFDVNIGDDATEVTVIEHAVLVASVGGAGLGTRLEQGHGASYDAGGEVGSVHSIDPATALAWRHGQFVAEDVPLTRVAAILQRHGAGRILVLGAARARRVSGTFAISDGAATLALLEGSLGLHVTRLGPFVLVRG